MRRLALTLLLLPLAACSSGSSATPSAAPTTPASRPAPVPVPVSASPSSAAARGAAAGDLVLRPDGLALRGAAGTTRLPFGTGRAVVVRALTSALGAPQQQAVECGQGARTDLESQGLAVLFDGDRFVGWDESGDGLGTAEGLRLGSTRAQLQRLYPAVTFSHATLGDEFLVSEGGLAGFLDGAAPTSRVTGLTGGEQCVVR